MNDTQYLLKMVEIGKNPFPNLTLAESRELLELTLLGPWKRTDEQRQRFEALYKKSYQTGV